MWLGPKWPWLLFRLKKIREVWWWWLKWMWKYLGDFGALTGLCFFGELWRVLVSFDGDDCVLVQSWENRIVKRPKCPKWGAIKTNVARVFWYCNKGKSLWKRNEKNFINYVIVLLQVWSLSRVILIVPLNTLKVNNVIVLG